MSLADNEYEFTTALDRYYLGVTAIVGILLQGGVSVFASFSAKKDSTILVAGTAFTLCTLEVLTWALGCGGTLATRNIVLFACLLVHSVHLYIFAIVRFCKLRARRRLVGVESPSSKYFSSRPKFPSPLAAVLFILFPFAALLPYTMGNSPAVLFDGGTRVQVGKPSDIIGLILLFFAFVIEVTALWTLFASELAAISHGVDADGAPLALQPSHLSTSESERHGTPAQTRTVPKRGFLACLPSPTTLLLLSTPLLAFALWLVSATPAFYAFPFPKPRYAQGLTRSATAALLASLVGTSMTAVTACVWARERRK